MVELPTRFDDLNAWIDRRQGEAAVYGIPAARVRAMTAPDPKPAWVQQSSTVWSQLTPDPDVDPWDDEAYQAALETAGRIYREKAQKERDRDAAERRRKDARKGT